jgi:UV DNA damage endonuclease
VTKRNREPFGEEVRERLMEAVCVADVQKILEQIREQRIAAEEGGEEEEMPKKGKKEASARDTLVKKQAVKNVPAPQVGSKLEEEDEDEDLSMADLFDEDETPHGDVAAVKTAPARQSRRATGKRKSYAEADELTEEE